jgi:hypothetical protein
VGQPQRGDGVRQSGKQSQQERQCAQQYQTHRQQDKGRPYKQSRGGLKSLSKDPLCQETSATLYLPPDQPDRRQDQHVYGVSEQGGPVRRAPSVSQELDYAPAGGTYSCRQEHGQAYQSRHACQGEY